MSVSKWKWTPECDKGICVGDCDQCDRSEPVFGEWILMSERKPKFGRYLVTKRTKLGGRQMALAMYLPDSDEWSGNGRFDDVIAWMPLPEPYVGGSDAFLIEAEPIPSWRGNMKGLIPYQEEVEE